MTKQKQIVLNYVGIVVSMVVIVLTSMWGVSANPQTIAFASLAMLNVVNIAHANDRFFLNRHRLLVAMILAGIVLPLLYWTGTRILTASEWPWSDNTRLPALILITIVVGQSAIVGFLRSTGMPNNAEAPTSET
ncbi:hypothetical protein SH449x_005185 [Pirellulaceae bacterium SH449]